MFKSGLINAIATKNGYRSYLEIATPTTGRQFELIDRSILVTCELAVYYIRNGDAQDYLANYKTEAKTSREIISNLAAAGKTYDIIFIDPFHTYENSMEDLAGAFNLINPGGAMIVHDCNPVDKTMVSSTFKADAWCGVTYWAFIDFVLGRSNMDYYTVDTDYGCGVIMKQEAAAADDRQRIHADWLEAAKKDDSRFEFFDLHRKTLLNLITVQHFSAMMGLPDLRGYAPHRPGWPWDHDIAF